MAARPEDVVDRQVDAYNRREIDAFVTCYAPAVVVEDATGGLLMQGHDAVSNAYGELFRESPDLHVEIAKRIQVGDYVIDEELVTGRRGAAEVMHAVVVYHVADGLIDHVRLIR